MHVVSVEPRLGCRQTAEHVNYPAGHKGSRVKSFSASPDGSTAVIVLFDSTVAVWDLVTMQCKCMLQKWGDRDSTRVHSGGVNAAYLTPDGSTAVTVSKDHTARVWDIASGECTHVMQGECNPQSKCYSWVDSMPCFGS